MNQRIYKHKCKNEKCGQVFYVEDLRAIGVAYCIKCHGDSDYIEEFKIVGKHDVLMDKESMEREMNNTAMEIMKRIQNGVSTSEPLLQITLQDESSVPKVIYKGEEIKFKTNVMFDWETETEEFGGLTYSIEHFDKENNPDTLTLSRMERRVGQHKFDYVNKRSRSNER